MDIKKQIDSLVAKHNLSVLNMSAVKLPETSDTIRKYQEEKKREAQRNRITKEERRKRTKHKKQIKKNR
jgi:hypothetical protein